MNTMSDLKTDAIRQDILTMVGGHFTPQALGRPAYEEILARARANAGTYLEVFQQLFLGPHFDAVSQADLLIPTFLELLADAAPQEVQAVAELLLKQYNAVLAFHDAATDRAAFLQLLPEDTRRLSQRFASRRRELQTLIQRLQSGAPTEGN
jgi:hypothetical protein